MKKKDYHLGFTQLGIIGIIAAVIVLSVSGFVGYEYIKPQNKEENVVGKTLDEFQATIEGLLGRGIGRIVECSNEQKAQYFYWGGGSALPASIMKKEGDSPWAATAVIPNPVSGSGIRYASVRDIAINPTNCDEVYVVAVGGVFKTENGGKIWKELPLFGEGAPPFPGPSIGENWALVALNPKNPKHVIFGFSEAVHSEAVGYRLRQTLDGGKSFLPVERERGSQERPTAEEITLFFEKQ